MLGMQLDMLIRTIGVSRTELASYSSAGTSPAITINALTFNVKDSNVFSAGKYRYDIQFTDGSSKMTIRKGFIIEEEETE
jgi:hypothetical protein